MFKRLLNISIWVLSGIAIIASLAFSRTKRMSTKPGKISVIINRDHGNYFIDEKEIEEMIKNLGFYSDSNSIARNAKDIERRIMNNPSVKLAEVFYHLDGSIAVKIEQRKPILRVFNKKGESFYIDEVGGIMPVTHKYTARVPVASGNINIPIGALIGSDQIHLQQFIYNAPNYNNRDYYNRKQINPSTKDSLLSYSQLQSLFELATYLQKNAFWNKQITQIHINRQEEIELIPAVGNHQILFGNIENINQKFNKLMTFYEKGLNKTGWNEYSEINLKYNKQVVCTKKYQ